MDLADLITDLRGRHGIHTAILYGSHARGDATPESDIDIATFSDDVTEITRDARLWNDVYLDGFVYPTAVLLAPPDAELTKLCGGKLLLDERGLAGALIERVDALERLPAPVLSEPEQRMRRMWARKMLARIRRGDVEAHYRFHWLLYQLLEDHFTLRARKYPGPKLALRELELREPATFAAFARALAPGAPLDALDALVDVVG
jgi:uncharacterized protein